MSCKNCDGLENSVKNGGKNEHSEQWTLIKWQGEQFAKTVQKLWITIIVLLGLWFSTIGVFVWYLNQYDFSSTSEVVVDGQDGTALYQDGEGNVINNGEGN